MKTKITFAHPVVDAQPSQIQAVISAASITLAISQIEVSQNVINLTADRLLTSAEKTSLRAAFYSTFPTIEDAE